MIYRNQSSQRLAVHAYTPADGASKTGDAANITCYLSIDWGAAAQLADANPTELDAVNMKGWYVFDLSQAETNGEVLVFAPVSATSGVVLDQVQVFTQDAAISSRASQMSLDTMDTNVDSILVDTGTDIPASIAALNDLSAAEAADATWATPLPGAYAAGTAGNIIGNIVSNVWSWISRTLTQSAASVIAAVTGSVLSITRGDTWNAPLTVPGPLTDFVALDFSVKEKKADSDDNAIVRIRLASTGVGDGLLRINKAAAATPANGSITIDDAALGNITIVLSAAETVNLRPYKGYHYDVQLITLTAVTTLTEGRCNVVADVTRAIV